MGVGDHHHDKTSSVAMDAESASEVFDAVAPGILWSSAKVGGASGVAGLAFGGVAGTLRSTTPVLFAVASSAQFATLGGVFWATRQTASIWLARNHGIAVAEIDPSQRTKISAVSGAITGASTGMLFRGRSNIVPGALVFSLLGYLGQNLANASERRNADASPKASASITERLLNSRYNPMTKLSDEEYRDMLNEKLVRIEAELELVDEDLAKLKAKHLSESEGEK